MWRRIRRIVRGELAHARRQVAERLRRLWHAECSEQPFSAAGAPERAGPQDAIPPEAVRKAFAALELPLTASADDVRHAWKQLMARYHPDRHGHDQDLERTATELSQRLTEARDLALAWCESRATARPRPRP